MSNHIPILRFDLCLLCIHVLKYSSVCVWGDAHTSLNFLSTHSTLSSTLLQHLTFCCMVGAHHPPSNLHVNKLALHHHTTVLFSTID